MFALVYVSRAVTSLDDDALNKLADQSSEKNSRLQITGYLNFNRARANFFQYLEGPQQAVLDLMAEIERDERHRVVNAAHLGEIESRVFPAWSMRYLDTEFFHAIRMEDALETILLTMNERTFDRELVMSTIQLLAKQIAKKPCGKY